MKYLYILTIMACSISLQANAFNSQSTSESQMAFYADEYIYSSVSFETEDCGTVTIDGWSSWNNGVCTGYCYDITGGCGSGNVSGASAPNGMFNGDGTVKVSYLQAQVDQQRRTN